MASKTIPRERATKAADALDALRVVPPPATEPEPETEAELPPEPEAPAEPETPPEPVVTAGMLLEVRRDIEGGLRDNKARVDRYAQALTERCDELALRCNSMADTIEGLQNRIIVLEAQVDDLAYEAAKKSGQPLDPGRFARFVS